MGIDMRLHAIGFGSLNLDEFWEVSPDFLRGYGLRTGEEYVRDLDWFGNVYPCLAELGSLKTVDPGGSASNTIAAMRRMGFRTGFYGATGRDDSRSLRLYELGDAHNLRIIYNDRPAGRCLALIDREDPSRDRALVILPSANNMAGDYEIDMSYFQSSEWVHITSFVSKSPLTAQIDVARNLSPPTRLSFDPGPIYCDLGVDELRPILRRTEILFTTEEELTMLTKDQDQQSAVNRVLGLGITTVVVKLGGRGVQGFVEGSAVHRPAHPPSRLVDRTGAGDVAAAGFLAGALHNLGIEACLDLAALAASRSIEGYGRSAYPDETFLQEYLYRDSKFIR